MDYIAMGSRIKAYRKMRGLTQGELAQKMGISTSFMGHIERGSRVASIETLVRLSDVLDVSLDMIVIGSERVTQGPEPSSRRMRMLNDVMRVLDEHANDWYRE